MIVDLLRRCYVTEMVFTPGQPAKRVQWVWCQPGAAPLPFPTSFNSSVWQRGNPWAVWGPVGETQIPPVYTNGRDPGAPPGICHVGTAQEFFAGLVGPGPTPLPELPACCQRTVSFRSRFGLVLRFGAWTYGRHGLAALLRLLASVSADTSTLHSLAARLQLGVEAAFTSAGLAELAAELVAGSGADLAGLAPASFAARLGLRAAITAELEALASFAALVGLRSGVLDRTEALAELAALLGIQAGAAMASTAGHLFLANMDLTTGFSTTARARAILGVAVALGVLSSATSQGIAGGEYSFSLESSFMALTEAEAELLLLLSIKGSIDTLTSAEAELLTVLAMQAGFSPTSHGTGVDKPSTAGQVSVSMTTAAFQVVTPAGGCGSLPAVMKARFSGFTGGCSSWNSIVITLTWNAGVSTWQGTGNSSTLGLSCNSGPHTWGGAISPAGPGGYTAGPFTLTGTSGANPTLTGTATFTGGCTGSGTVTVTRT
jgi:hypothetical protein